MRSLPSLRERGFSLVELLVALVFTGLLMAGLALVYKSSIQSFRLESEKLSSSRRNRIAMEIIRDDLGLAGQALSNIVFHTTDVATNYPLFAIFPDGTASTSVDEQRDQLQFFFEEALPFEGRIYKGSGSSQPISLLSSNEAIADSTLNVIKPTNLDPIYLNFRNATFRDRFVTAVTDYKSTTSPINIVAKDSWRVLEAAGATPDGTTAAKVTLAYRQDRDSGGVSMAFPLGKKEYSAWVGTGSYGSSTEGAPVTIVRPRLLARYTIENLGMDPSDTSKTVPCLIRTVVPYDSVATDAGTRTVIAEDVVGLKIRVSVDDGTTWLGGATGDQNGSLNDRLTAWTALKAKIDTAIKLREDPFRAYSLADSSWFRYFPLLLRLDITTRTATARAVAAGNKVVYTKNTRVLVTLPRYFGMPLTSTQ